MTDCSLNVVIIRLTRCSICNNECSSVFHFEQKPETMNVQTAVEISFEILQYYAVASLGVLVPADAQIRREAPYIASGVFQQFYYNSI